VGPPVLFALFAASSDPADSAGGPTELRAYTWAGSTVTQIAAFTFASATSPVEVGTALAIDPADGDSVYVALGKGGIWRADLAGSTLSATEIWDSSTLCFVPSGDTPYNPEHVRDIAVVRVATNPPQSVLYAALNYGEVLELANLGSPGASCARFTLGPPGYPVRIAAITNAGTSALVALAAQRSPEKYEETTGPYHVNGFWSDVCLQSGAPDPGAPDPPLSVTNARIHLYEHDFALAGSGLVQQGVVTFPVSVYGTGDWNSIVLRPGASSTTNRMFISSRDAGTEVYDIDRTTWQASPIGGAFVGDAFGAGDSLTSFINQGVVEFGYEYSGAITKPKGMVYIDPLTSAITPVPKTEWSPCANDYPANPVPNCEVPIDPGLYAGGIFEEAHFLDPNPTNREFFVAGRKILERFVPDTVTQTCPTLADCIAPTVPCDPSTFRPNWYLRKRTTPIMTAWRLISLLPGSGMPADGPALQPRWWQFETPLAAVTTTQPEEVRAGAVDYAQSITEVRTTNGVPNVLYLSRAGSSHGVKAVRTIQLVDKAYGSCSQSSPGVGELLTDPVTQLGLDIRTTLTHLELELNGSTPCIPIVPCLDSAGFHIDGSRQLATNHTDLYQTRDASGAPMWVLAIAAGYPASTVGQVPPGHAGQSSSCAWIPFAGRSMLVLVDVTKTGDGVMFASPLVLRVGLGSGQGHAFSVRTKTVGRKSYAYVGDILGKLMVYDVTGSNLLPLPSQPYVPNTLFLVPFELSLPKDPYDGWEGNCIDMEIVGNFLYCSLGRLGVGIFNLADPAHPQLIGVIDTPGIVTGLSTRTVGSVTQLIVGDSRCGIRVYQ
jgi:hypothetical protein